MQTNESRNFSESTAQEIDDEVRTFVTGGHDIALKILNENLDTLHRLAQALLDKETLDGAEVEIIMKGGSLGDIDKERSLRAQDLAKENEEKAKSDAEKEKKEAEEKLKSGGPLGDPDPAMA